MPCPYYMPCAYRNVLANRFPVPPSPSFLRSFKSAATKRINKMHGTTGTPVWQRNYYEHVIRDEQSWDCIRKYVVNNPPQWELDRENPNAGPEFPRAAANPGVFDRIPSPQGGPVARHAAPGRPNRQWRCDPHSQGAETAPVEFGHVWTPHDVGDDSGNIGAGRVFDAFVAMPNHVHGIIVITGANAVCAGLVPAPVPAHDERATTRVAPYGGKNRSRV